jgi:hypothetical protein
MSLFPRTTALLMVSGALGIGCLGPLDNATVVHDLRILGISMDPPEVQYRTHGDAGLFGICSVDLTEDIGSVSNITLSALVGDPGGGGRSLHYVFTGCPSDATGICPDGGGYVLASGDGPAPELTATWPLAEMATEEFEQTCPPDQTCPGTPLIAAFSSDPFGLCRFGIGFQVGLEVDSPDGEVIYGSKLMIFTPVPDDYPSDPAVCPQGPDGGPPPLTNPVLEAFDLDGVALPLDSAPEVSAAFSHLLRPIEPSDGPQSYCLPTYTGGWTQLTETWLFSAVTDVGQFDREIVGGAAEPGSDETGPSTDLDFTWTFPDGGAGLQADLYEVTRNGRGGTSWIIRHADVTN